VTHYFVRYTCLVAQGINDVIAPNISFALSVIIPAHNEEGQIGETLTNLQLNYHPVLELIVCCNGCSDRTASVARSVAPCAIVLESSVASKTNALNLSDEHATRFPRVYLDADIRLSPAALPMLVSRMSETGALIASPRAVMDFESSSLLVRAYYAVWLALPYVREGLIGTGVYVLSREGRSRFGEFPQLIADDGYVRAHFKPFERLLVEECYALVRAPRDLRNLVKIKTRSRLGVYELQLKYPHLAASGGAASGGFRFVAMRPSLWAPALVYLGVNFYTRWRARRMAREKGFNIWERDDSRRGGAPDGG
jgi:glycosyltransferase involved in cell wall biosynthesis